VGVGDDFPVLDKGDGRAGDGRAQRIGDSAMDDRGASMAGSELRKQDAGE
jgi:hypothetical protein